MIKVISSPEEFRAYRKTLNGTIGFVPTMGALHQGHAALLREARRQSDHVVLSIFVNPTQFNDPSDLDKYPRTIEQDQKLAESEGVEALFFPSNSNMYPDNYLYEVSEKEFSRRFCGAHRKGHFEGVLTVVLKLLNLVQPHRAFFGEKDYQQLQLIKGMAKAFFLDLEVVGVPTQREADGLAMSSRNIRLTPTERQTAPHLYQVLKSAPSASKAIQQLTELGFSVEYVEDWNQRRLAAVHLGSVRLIDNVEI